jgi:uncharacterized cupredoxin-like copper-binding protein
MKHRWLIAGAVAVMVVLGMAFGPMRDGQSAMIVASPAASPNASPAATPTGRSVSVANSVTINHGDAGFDPVYVESTNGHDLTITLVNTGTRQHAFRIDRYEINVSLAPGEQKTIVIKSPSLGDFPYYSDAPGDEGMEGNLTFYI